MKAIGKAKERLSWLVLFVLVVSGCLGLVHHYRDMTETIDEQREFELEEENEVAAYYFQTTLESKLEWMRMFAMAAGMSDGGDAEEWWKLIGSVNSDEERIGVMDAEGKLYYGAHMTKDVSDKDYFQRAIRGESYISPLNTGELNGMDSVILSVPIEDLDGEILGAVAMEVSTMALGGYANNVLKGWDQYGANLVVDSEGRLIASYPGMEGYDTIYDVLETKNFKDPGLIDALREDIRSGESGHFKYYNSDDVRRMLYYEPIGINDWSMVSIGTMKKYLTILAQIEERSFLFSCVFIAIILFGVLVSNNLVRIRKKKLNLLRRDALTAVYRRGVGEEIIKNGFEAKGSNPYYGCLFIDLDDFKRINDVYGHDKGDALLNYIGKTLKASSRQTDVVYRYGGDEFCIWLSGHGGKEEIAEIGRRIFSNLEKGGEIHLSIGATLIRDDDDDWRLVLRRADEAVYSAKREGKNRLAFYEDI